MSQESKAGWTAGPWKVSARTHSHLIEGGGCRMLAEVHSYSGNHGPDVQTRRANARLMAASPDLHYALKLMIGEGDPAIDWAKRFIIARAALEKANGPASVTACEHVGEG
jgi:hypothetical protein